jgi:hypothetical protein
MDLISDFLLLDDDIVDRPTKLDAYAEAERIDTLLRRLVERYNIPDNKRSYKLFCRTVSSTLDIIGAATEDERFLTRWIKKEEDTDDDGTG